MDNLDEFRFINFLNADEVLKELRLSKGVCQKDNKLIFIPDAITSYSADLLVAYRTDIYLKSHKTFSLEIIFSNIAKIDMLRQAKANGYKIYLYCITTDNVNLNIERVALRVMAGGHKVPQDKIMSRYSKSLSNIPTALAYVHRAFFWDNTVKPDFFSVQAVDNLPDVFQNWKLRMSEWFKTSNKAGLQFPRFFGVIPQMTKKYTTPNSAYAVHAEEWNTHINKGIIAFLRTYHQNYATYTLNSTLQDEASWFSSVFSNSKPFIVQECVHFTDKLRTLAEQAALPVCFLNDDVCKSLPEGKGIRVELNKTSITPDYQKTHSSILEEYTYIADSILKL